MTISSTLSALYRDEDWLANWTGLTLVALAVIPLVSGTQAILLPDKWTYENGTGFTSNEVIIGTFAAFIVVFIVCFAASLFHRSKKFPTAPVLKTFIPMLFVIMLIAFCSLWVGRSRLLSSIGLGYALWSLLFGFILSGCVRLSRNTNLKTWLESVTKREGFFIKSGLVLLGVDLSTLGAIGLPGLLVTYLVPPLIIVCMWHLGTRLFKLESKTLVITVAAGCAVCGNSAATAASAASGGSSEELPVVIGLLTVGTTFFMLVQPYFAILVGMNEVVAGAWIGGSVDLTGQVLAAASIISPTAETVAGIIKIIQNTLIGFVAVGIAVFWTFNTVKHEDEHKDDVEITGVNPPSNIDIATKTKEKKNSVISEIWTKFPIFTLGFFIHSILKTFILSPVLGHVLSLQLSFATKALSNWLFAMAFVSIGFGVDVAAMRSSLKGGGIIYTYLIGQVLDLCLTYLVSWLVFSGVWFRPPTI